MASQLREATSAHIARGVVGAARDALDDDPLAGAAMDHLDVPCLIAHDHTDVPDAATTPIAPAEEDEVSRLRVAEPTGIDGEGCRGMRDLDPLEGEDILDEARAVKWPRGNARGAVAVPKELVAVLHDRADELGRMARDLYRLVAVAEARAATTRAGALVLLMLLAVLRQGLRLGLGALGISPGLPLVLRLGL